MPSTEPTPHEEHTPLLLHRLHRAHEPGDHIDLSVTVGAVADIVEPATIAVASPTRLTDLLDGGGFSLLTPARVAENGQCDIVVRRERTLADTAGPGMRVLLVGLNPSLHAADAGYGFAGPSNRFWKAALAAGLVTVERDPIHALTVDAVGMTDLVKRATTKASEIRASEFRDGLHRLDRLARWLEPKTICVVGITGWRHASGDRVAELGWQRSPLGERPVYVMPNPSGLNAHTNHDDLVAHFTTAIGGR